MKVIDYTPQHQQSWREFTEFSACATLFHSIEWRELIQKSTGHRPFYLMAEDDGEVYGILPQFLIASRLFGRMLVSMPYLNYGGVCCENAQAEAALLKRAMEIAGEQKATYVELRHLNPLIEELPQNLFKVTYLISLEGGQEAVWKRLHSNVRNKIRKAEKNGIEVEHGNHLIGDFYRVYSHNMRDLGTPVMPRRFFEEIVAGFPEDALVYVGRQENKPIAAKLVLYHKETVYFVWSSAIRSYMRLGPTPLLNWTAIQDAIERGCQTLDLGRSTKGGGPEAFKKYWGGQAKQLYWQYLLPSGEEIPGLNPTNPKFDLAIRVWKKLPVPLTRLIGPYLAVNLP